jgi:NAD(P)-dependent dehydrogenase (short-subunit alcohol dehydrogenase family)
MNSLQQFCVRVLNEAIQSSHSAGETTVTVKVKVALVTGAAAGTGAAISRRLARDGIAIGVLDLALDGTTKVANEIVAAGGKAIPLQADITDRAQVKAAIARLRAAFGPLTILVNNAVSPAPCPLRNSPTRNGTGCSR